MTPRPLFLAVALVSCICACSGGGGSPSASSEAHADFGIRGPQPTPTPLPTPVPTATPTAISATPALNDWVTYGYDNDRDGYNPNTANFTPSQLPNLHLAWEANLNSYNTWTQPILATNIGNHAGILMVGASGSGNEVAFDALTGAQLWSTSLGTSTITCGATYNFGIGGTGVYDPVNRSYFAATNVSSGNYQPTQINVSQLDPATGNVVATVNVAPTLEPGEFDLTHTALTLANGNIYAGTSSSCDHSSWRGRIVAVNESTMSLSSTLFTTYEQAAEPSPGPFSGGGVWSWGGVSADNGTIYFSVGNADTNAGADGATAPFTQQSTEHEGLAEHFVAASADLSTVLSSNYPGFTYSNLSADLDLQGSPVIGHPLRCPAFAAVQGKSGAMYLYRTANVSSGPYASYSFTPSTYHAMNIGNPAYSPANGLLYASVASSQGSELFPAGMIAINPCYASKVVWTSQFGPDSAVVGAMRSMPTLSAGGLVFVVTPCYADSSGGCAGSTTTSLGGALWGLDAATGVVLNGGKPILRSTGYSRMGVILDGDWLYFLDNDADLFALTLDPSVPAMSDRLSRRRPPLHRMVWQER